MIFNGKAHILGDNIDTDTIIPAKYCATFEPSVLREHLLEKFDPSFKNKVTQGDILFAGENFGHGSSREHAPLALKAVGISAVIVKSVARIFYRNAFNIGMPVIECNEAVHLVQAGDSVEVDLKRGVIEINQLSINIKPIPEFMQKIIEKGGLIEYYSGV